MTISRIEAQISCIMCTETPVLDMSTTGIFLQVCYIANYKTHHIEALTIFFFLQETGPSYSIKKESAQSQNTSLWQSIRGKKTGNLFPARERFSFFAATEDQLPMLKRNELQAEDCKRTAIKSQFDGRGFLFLTNMQLHSRQRQHRSSEEPYSWKFV